MGKFNHQSVLTQIGDQLRALRKEAGYTSYENFAFDHDLSRVHYGRIEKGSTNLTIKTLVKILEIHNKSITEFFSQIK